MTSWKGYDRRDFQIEGRDAILVSPRQPRAGRPWIWRTEFFGAFDWADLALLDEGFHLAYVDVQNLYGAPISLDAMDALYDHLLSRHSLAASMVLEGFSRGALFALNWALRHTGRVAGLYLDAPVCDFNSWPGGAGRVARAADDWDRLLAAYGLTENEAVWTKGPLHHLASLAAARIPILAVYGDADQALPPEENVQVLESRYRQLGGEIEIIRKAGIDHHPHSLQDPAPIVAALLGWVSRP